MFSGVKSRQDVGGMKGPRGSEMQNSTEETGSLQETVGRTGSHHYDVPQAWCNSAWFHVCFE